MGANTKIEWATHTFNPWVGCTAVSQACDFCYAEAWAKRTGHAELWQGDRRRTSAPNWQQPLKWDRAAAAAGERHRVFCASLADVFDNQVPPKWRDDLWFLIDQTPHLDWLLLTKRPQNIRKFLPDPRTGIKPWGDGWPNVWLGTTAENQTEFNRRWSALRDVRATILFLSMEPLLGDILFRPAKPDWIIAGGESGPHARPMHPDWVRSLRDQCAAAGTPFHFKQWGEWQPHVPVAGGDLGGDVRTGRVRIVHPTGQSDVEVFDGTGRLNTIPSSRYMQRVGKKRAGRLLDGVEHNGAPDVVERINGATAP